MKTRYTFIITLFLLVFLISIRVSAQTAYTWSGATNTSYTTASNWVPEGIPGPDDSALIPAVVTNFPVLTVNHTTGSLTIESDASLRVQGNGSVGSVTLTLVNDLQNDGEFQLGATSSWTGVLTIAEGKLVNHGRVISGQTNTHTSSNIITSEIDNRGTILVERPLTINQAGSIHSNTGEIRLEEGNLTVTQSGTDPAFVNNGTLFIGLDHTANFIGGKLINTVSGTVTGIGTLAISSTTFENHGPFMPGLRPAFGINLIVNGDAESNTAGNTSSNVAIADNLALVLSLTGDEFFVITYGAHTGEFSFIAGTDLGNGLFLVPNYNSGNMVLTVPGEPIELTAPELLSLADGSTDVSTIPDLRWNLVAGTAACHLQVSKNDDFSEPILDKDDVLAVTWRTGQLDPFETYHWRVRATNSAGAGEWSPDFTFTTGATVVNIDDEVAEMPDEYFLISNYPNPFNPQTTIRFGLQEAGFVTLDVNDMLGVGVWQHL
ncbi:MAG: hypothetical protein ACNA8K_03715 [Cyclonatronaceae bacterium]